MAGFSPVGSAPVAAVGGNSGNFYPASGGIVFHGSNATTNQVFLAPGRLVFQGATPTPVTAPPRLTWIGVEALSSGALSARLTWIGVEALHQGLSAARVSWDGAEVLRTVATLPTITQVTWVGAEVLDDGAAAERVTWTGAEVAHDGAAADRVTWIGAEVLLSLVQPDTGFVYLIFG